MKTAKHEDVEIYDAYAGTMFHSEGGRPTLPGCSPERCPGSYSMDWYCKYLSSAHTFREFPHIYEGQTRGEHVSQARDDGWILHRDLTATCPKCAKALKIGKFKPKGNGVAT